MYKMIMLPFVAIIGVVARHIITLLLIIIIQVDRELSRYVYTLLSNNMRIHFSHLLVRVMISYLQCFEI